MACPPVREDNPRALASGLSYVQVDKHGTYISVDLAYHEIFRAKVGEGGINDITTFTLMKHSLRMSFLFLVILLNMVPRYGIDHTIQRVTFVYILMSILSSAVFTKFRSQIITTALYLYYTFLIRKVSL